MVVKCLQGCHDPAGADQSPPFPSPSPYVRPCRVHGRKWRRCCQRPGVATYPPGRDPAGAGHRESRPRRSEPPNSLSDALIDKLLKHPAGTACGRRPLGRDPAGMATVGSPPSGPTAFPPPPPAVRPCRVHGRCGHVPASRQKRRCRLAAYGGQDARLAFLTTKRATRQARRQGGPCQEPETPRRRQVAPGSTFGLGVDSLRC